MQRGFHKRRSMVMVANIVDIDFETSRISLIFEAEALVPFDFRASFPSISYSYLMTV